jgi:hypothetical protein
MALENCYNFQIFHHRQKREGPTCTAVMMCAVAPMMEEKTLNDILAAWSKEFQKQDPNFERILKRKSKENLIQTILSDGQEFF